LTLVSGEHRFPLPSLSFDSAGLASFSVESFAFAPGPPSLVLAFFSLIVWEGSETPPARGIFDFEMTHFFFRPAPPGSPIVIAQLFLRSLEPKSLLGAGFLGVSQATAIFFPRGSRRTVCVLPRHGSLSTLSPYIF